MRVAGAADHRRRAPRADREGAPPDGRAEDRRADAVQRHVARLLHRTSAGAAASGCSPASSRRRASRSSCVRRSKRTAPASRSRSARSATAPPTSAPGTSTRARTSGSRRGCATAGIATGRLGIEETVKFVFSDGVAKAAPRRHADQRHAGDRRLPDDQGRARARADAARVDRDAQGLRGGLQGAEGRA